MRNKIILFVILVMAFLLLQKRHVGYYQITEVYDGDTIAVSMGGVSEKVRLIGVDTPETVDPRKPIQCYGPEASKYSHHLLEGAKVRLVSDPLSTNRDRYNRLLRYVYLPDGTLYNKRLLQDGVARSYTGFPFTKTQDFVKDESMAKTKRLGLWGACTTEADLGA